MSAKAIGAVVGVVGLLALLGFGVIDKNDEAIAVGDAAPVPEPSSFSRPGAGRGSPTASESVFLDSRP